MLAPAVIPEKYEQWNRRYGAPRGKWAWYLSFLKKLFLQKIVDRYRGPFIYQGNSRTRAFEYPWAFDVAQITPGMRVLEIGGGLSGFQFVLSKNGCSVVNVDPGLEAQGVGWPCDQSTIQHLNNIFRTCVELRNTTVGEAGLEHNRYERAFCISVLEHLAHNEIPGVMSHVYASLKPGGLFVVTVDLFLNLQPFCSRQRNKYGGNVNIQWLLSLAPFQLIVGERQELFGCPEFSPDHILCNLDQYYLGEYPVCVECLVLKKPSQHI